MAEIKGDHKRKELIIGIGNIYPEQSIWYSKGFNIKRLNMQY